MLACVSHEQMRGAANMTCFFGIWVLTAALIGGWPGLKGYFQG